MPPISSPCSMGEKLSIGAVDEDIFDRSRRVRWLDLDAVSKARVLMVGAGALGNEVAKDLALSGARRITVVDMDHVVGSNLNRCLFFSREDARLGRFKAEVVVRGIARLSQEAVPKAIVSRVEDAGQEIFREHDVILGCLDNIAARVHTNSHAYHAGKPYIDGGMDGFVGKVMVAKPPDGACLQCGMNRSHARIADFRFSCTGRDVVFHEPKMAAEITTTSVISAIMVREALKYISGRRSMLLSNAFYYDGQRNVSEEIEISLDSDCPVHTKK